VLGAGVLIQRSSASYQRQAIAKVEMLEIIRNNLGSISTGIIYNEFKRIKQKEGETIPDSAFCMILVTIY